jgi:hypothetical protein
VTLPPRIPSRAAVLHASTSRSPQSSPYKSPPPKPTPLEHFIATRPAQSILPAQPAASTSQAQHRSVSFSSTSSTHSRKGKERAQPSPVANPTPPQNSRRPPRTPRRWSVELAPESGVYWEKTEVEDSVEEPAGINPPTRTTVLPRDVRPRSREASMQSDSGLKSSVSNRLSRILSHPSPPPQPPPMEDISLPALPEPDAEGSHADDESDSRTLSSRRAGLFRSSPSFTRQMSPFRPIRDLRRAQEREETFEAPGKPSIHRGVARDELRFAPPTPIREGFAKVSTPTKHVANQTITGETPHPPGRWASPGETKGKSGVRFSTPEQTLPADQSLASSANTSVHRLKLSLPRSSPSPQRSPQIKARLPADLDPDSSFLSRVKTSISRTILPKPSQTLIEAQNALAIAAKASQSAQEKVEVTQRQWIDALSALSNQSAGVREVVRQGWNWSSWVWWVGLEILLVWAVFR